MITGLLVVLGLALLCTAPAQAGHGGKAETRLTIAGWPKGLFGIVKSERPGVCAKQRRVVVFRQVGRRNDSDPDERIGAFRAKRSHGFNRWSAKGVGSGSFYAKALAKRHCKRASSRTVGPGLGGTGDGSTLPPCGPYISEGSTNVCRFDELHLDIDRYCRNFSASSDVCLGVARYGLFPWARTPGGWAPEADFRWDWGTHQVLYVAYPDGSRTGIAHLGGTMPGSGSAAFSITDGFAQNESGYPNGDHFFTPDLPGQGPGEIGGPLRLRFDNGTIGADVYISGYLYLKQ